MLGIRKVYQMLMNNVVPSLGVVPHSNTSLSTSNKIINEAQAQESRAKALITIFGMDKDGRIAKDKACKVVKQLGLVKEDNDESSFYMLEEQLEAKKVFLELEQEEKREKEQLLRQAFKVFDEDGDGFIDAKEIKRVLMCLGLDNGWDMKEIEKMIKVVDLNLDGKVDFQEFELMMG
ncbi:calmodulin-like protein 2 [Amaranthus tricolor]|uniref:calmodulin-like protein 2 n=1 Tax=Amaranthus tricolor TaxID=29722 RepID=UPI00258CF755|nr:calmodulin-like protein 2 [Amaranthus tricolor]